MLDYSRISDVNLALKLFKENLSLVKVDKDENGTVYVLDINPKKIQYHHDIYVRIRKCKGWSGESGYTIDIVVEDYNMDSAFDVYNSLYIKLIEDFISENFKNR
jgi:hypothetical protein